MRGAALTGDPSAPARVLACGRVRLWAELAGEAEALALVAAVEEVVGPAPWAFVLEPTEPSGPWEVRVDLPEPGSAPALAERLPSAVFEVESSPGLVEAVDRGWLVEERADVGGVRVRRLTDPAGTRSLDLHRARAEDPELHRLEAGLAEAARPFPLHAEPGAAALVPVVHRPTGRVGAEVWVGGDPLPERARVLASIAAFVAREPLLVPEVDWEEALGALVVHVWLAVPFAAGLPGDPDLAAEPEDVPWWGDHVGHGAEVELQFVPRSPADHDPLVAAVSAAASDLGLVGGPPRWVRVAGRRVFVPTWVGALPPPEALRTLRTVAGVVQLRVVPGVPFGLEAHWPVLEPAWRTVGGVVWQRLHDPVVDRDRLEEVVDREAEARDHAAAAAVAEDVRPVLDTTGRRGLEVRAGPAGFTEEGLRDLLTAAAALREPGLTRIGTFGFGRDGVAARRWWRDGVDPGPRRWEVVGR